MNPLIEELKAAISKEAEKKLEVQLLMTHPGVGPTTGLAFVLVIGNPERFRCGKQIGSYLGLIPPEESSAGRQRLGHISKQGNRLLRFLLIEASHNTVRLDPEWRRHFLHLAMRRGRAIAQVMVARKLAVRHFWIWRKGWTYQQVWKFGSHVEYSRTGCGGLLPGDLHRVGIGRATACPRDCVRWHARPDPGLTDRLAHSAWDAIG